MWSATIVREDYLFDDQRKSFKHIRLMNWRAKGTWHLPEDIRLPIKTLTDISEDSDLLEHISRLVGLDDRIDTADPVRAGMYTKEMAMKDLFLPESQFDEPWKRYVKRRILCCKDRLVLARRS